MNKNAHTFDEWFEEVKKIVKEGRPMYLIGTPDPNEPEECHPLSDEQLEVWDKENRKYFVEHYDNGDDPHYAIWEFVM